LAHILIRFINSEMLVLLFSLLAKMVIHRDQKNNIPMIVMPFVERHPNTINDALISVDRARGEMPVLLVSGTPGYKDHAAGWCNWFQCIESPPVPPTLLEHAINSDNRGDTEDFLRWRTKEAWDALFAMKSFLKTKRNWLIWLQDDTVVVDLYDLPDQEITCLRVGTEYCGMVAYKLKRWVVEEFVKRIELEMHFKPIDWILDSLRQDLGLALHRVGKVQHKGHKSSNSRNRRVDE